MCHSEFLLGMVYICFCEIVFFFKQKTAYEMRISDWSSDVCSSDLFADSITWRLKPRGCSDVELKRQLRFTVHWCRDEDISHSIGETDRHRQAVIVKDRKSVV